MKTKDILEGIQSRTKQNLPPVIKFKNVYFASTNGWTKQQVVYSIAERGAEVEWMRDRGHAEDLERLEVWTPFVDRQLKPSDISEKNMEQFVLDWSHATSNWEGDAVYDYQEKALEELGRNLIKALKLSA